MMEILRIPRAVSRLMSELIDTKYIPVVGVEYINQQYRDYHKSDIVDFIISYGFVGDKGEYPFKYNCSLTLSFLEDLNIRIAAEIHKMMIDAFGSKARNKVPGYSGEMVLRLQKLWEDEYAR